MWYWRAKCDAIDLKTGHSMVKGELLTKRERFSRIPNISDKMLEVVDISKNRTYKIFGIRFEVHET